MSSPDLFVVCKSCSKEVSPYVTECSYCGARLRKRAPKIERSGEGEPKPPKPSRRTRKIKAPREPKERAPRLGRLRGGEIPGIRGDEDARPWATIVLVVLSFGIWLSLAFVVIEDVAIGAVGGDPWRYLTASLLNDGLAAQLATVVGLVAFGAALERRHGAALVLGLFLLCGPVALLVTSSLDVQAFVFGTHPAALGLLAAWAIPILLARRRTPGEPDDEADMLAALVIGAVLLLIPLVSQGSALAGLIGGGLGALAGLVLARVRPR